MTVTLQLDGKQRTYVLNFISARMLRRTIEISKTVNFDDISVAELDIMVGYLVQLFGNQFTVDDVYDGLSATELIPTLIGCIQEVVGELSNTTTGDEKNA